MKRFIGLDIGGSKIAGGLFGEDGHLYAETMHALPQDYETFLEICAKTVADIAGEADREAPVGVGSAGAVDLVRGGVHPANIPFLKGRALRDDLSLLLGRPVRLGNDANCFVLAEAVDGAGAGADSVFGITLGTGLGGGFVFGGRVLNGANGTAAEWGHVPFPYDPARQDPPPVHCPCGRRGCIETMVSGRALTALYKAKTGLEADGKSIAAKVQKREAAAVEVLDIFYDRLVRALHVVLYTFDPEVIVVGGRLSALPGLYDAVTLRWAASGKQIRTRFVPAKFGPTAGCRGAAWLWIGG